MTTFCFGVCIVNKSMLRLYSSCLNVEKGGQDMKGSHLLTIIVQPLILQHFEGQESKWGGGGGLGKKKCGVWWGLGFEFLGVLYKI